EHLRAQVGEHPGVGAGGQDLDEARRGEPGLAQDVLEVDHPPAAALPVAKPGRRVLVYPTRGRAIWLAESATRPAARKERVPLKFDRRVLVAACASMAVVSPTAAQAPKAKPQPAAAATPPPLTAAL